MAVELWYGEKPGNPGDPHLERRVEGKNALQNASIVRFGQASYTLLINDS